MKEHGLIFKGQLIPALLDGSKKLTRRLPKSRPKRMDGGSWYWKHKSLEAGYCHTSKSRMMGFMLEHGEYQIGDLIWVRETTQVLYVGDIAVPTYSVDGAWVPKKDRWETAEWWYSKPKCPSIHMPRWASRIILEITDIRVERLHDISEKDAIAEGVERVGNDTAWKDYLRPGVYLAHAVDSYISLWNSLYGNWDENPWVYVIEFKKVDE